MNRQTGFTPNMMMFGREVILPVNLMIGDTGLESLSPIDYVSKLRETQQKVHMLARDKLRSTQERQAFI